MKEHKQCSEKVYDNWHYYPCAKNATVERDGKLYCGAHDPIKVEARRAKTSARCDKEFNERVAASIAGAACYKINPDNPRAVAESIGDMYEALKGIIQRRMECHEMETASIPNEIEAAYKALAKAEGTNVY